jgi:hypothetical protein
VSHVPSDNESLPGRPIDAERSGWPPGLVLAGLAWLAALAIPGATGVILAATTADHPISDEQGQHIVVTIGLLLGAALLVTVLVGFVAWRYRSWRALTVASLVGTGWLLTNYVVGYILVAAITDPQNTDSDIGAGAGAAILSVPTFVVIALLLGVGAAIAWIWSRVSDGREASTS